MKKRLEAELISIAHRVLKLKNKSEVDQLYKETQKLYETLTVLKFYQDNFELIKSDITQDALEEKLEQSIISETLQETAVEEKQPVFEHLATVENELEIEEIKSELESEVEEEVTAAEESEPEVLEEDALENEKETLEEEMIVAKEPEVSVKESLFKPIFELEVDDEELIAPAEIASEIKPGTKHVALEDLLGENYVDPVFVKPNEVSLFAVETKEEEPKEAPKAVTFNETTSKSIAIGLNDRIGFVQNLFNDSNEDFNRVISQLNTFDTYAEAKNFINEMVIPDYNYWIGKEDYLERFMEIVEKKFT